MSYVEQMQTLAKRDIPDSYKKGKMFELYCCLEFGLKMFEGLDKGIDLLSENGAYQCKNWESSLTYRDLSTFIAYSYILGYKDMTLLYTYSSQTVPINVIGDFIKYKHVVMDEQKYLKQQVVYQDIPVETSLRRCQKECLNKMETIIRGQYGKYFFQLHTASGKSLIIYCFIIKHINKRSLILVPSILLMHQFKDLFKDDDDNISCFGTGFQDQPIRQINICVYNSVEKVIGYEFDYVFIDEAHHIYKPDVYEINTSTSFDTENIENTENSICGKSSIHEKEGTYIDLIRDELQFKYQFNFSATLQREESQIDYLYSLQQAVQDGVVVDYNFHFMMYQNDILDLNYIKLEDKKTLIYCASIADCITVSQQLKCNYLDGNMNQTERQRIINDFRDNKQFLCSCRTLSEGIDLPYVDSCIFYSEKNSQVDIIQCIGRAQRLYQGKQKANIYVLVKTDDMESDVMKKKVNKYCKCLFEFDDKCKQKISVRGIKQGFSKRVESLELKYSELIGELVVKDCSRLVMTTEWKFEQCCKWLQEHDKQISKSSETLENGFKIGQYFDGLKQGKNQEIKQRLEQQFNISISVTRKIEKVDYNKEELCSKWLQEHDKQLPKFSETLENGFKIGKYFDSLKQGYNPKIKQRLEQQFNISISVMKKIEKREKVDYNKEELCCKWLQEHDKQIPKQSETLENGFKIGTYFDGLKSGCNPKIKQRLEQQFNINISVMKKMEKVDYNKEELCCKWLQEHDKQIPKYSETLENGFKIGRYFCKLKSGQNQEIRQRLEQQFNISISVTKKMEKVDYNKEELCYKWLQEHDKQFPKWNETLENGFKIGAYFTKLKSGRNLEIKQRLEQQFNISISVTKKIEKREKVDYNKEELCCKWLQQHDKQFPKRSETLENGFKIGQYFTSLKSGCNPEIKQRLEQQFNIIIPLYK